MRKIQLYYIAVLFFLVVLLPVNSFAQVSDPAGHIIELFQNWQYEDGVEEARRLYAQSPEDPIAIGLMAAAHFYSGEYEKANNLFDKVPEIVEGSRSFKEIAVNSRDVYEVTKGMKRFVSDDGNFILLTKQGKDEILSLFVFDTIQTAYKNLSADMGYSPPLPVRIEVYETVNDLARASPLTEEEIKNSGTIALSKYNRLMITSPQSLLRGYHWKDTLTHEFVHYIMGKATDNKLVLWLHEGLARTHETRWNGSYRELSYNNKGLLKWALQKPKERLISIKEMGSSFAKLPTQSKAELAYSQVFYAMKFLKSRVGNDFAKKIMKLTKSGVDSFKVVEKLSGMSYNEFEKAWRVFALNDIKVPPLSPGEYPTLYSFIALGGGDEENEQRSIEDIKSKEALRYVRLAEIMNSRGYMQPAIAEYRKALKQISKPDPVVMNRFVKALLKEKLYEEAKPIIEKLQKNFPGELATRMNSARYFLGKNDLAKAAKFYEKSNEINPMHPEIHIALYGIYKKLDKPELVKREKKAIEFLRRR